MTLRFRLALLTGLLSLCGCSDSFNAGPLTYEDADNLTRELADKTKPNLAGKAKLQEGVRKGLAKLFGPDPRHIRVPEGSGLPNGGIHLANLREVKEGNASVVSPIRLRRGDGSGGFVEEDQAGGFALYRRHCLHCHGVTGSGNGPTADFLYPRPRDFRPGKFKFTSTPNGAKPSRDDLRRSIRDGLHGTPMPAFEALLTPWDIEEVIDYVIFLSARGETEQALIEEASIADENDPEALSDEVLATVSSAVFGKWKNAEKQVFNPPVARVPATPESIKRGRDLFLGIKSRKGATVDCIGCHGPRALGNGPSFVPEEVFEDVVFGGDPSSQGKRLERYSDKTRDLWKNSMDEWGNPLRPANLNRGVYKGGRRPIDLFWRIAKGINGAKMPGHYPAIEADEVWDLVNFLLALPYDSRLLKDAKPATPTVARR